MGSKAKSALSLLAKICVALGLIIYLVRSGHLDLRVILELMTLPNVVIALVLLGITMVLSAWRWIILLKARDFNIPFGYGVSLYMIGMFFNYALPGSVSGDLVRGYYLVQDYPARKMDAILSVLIDRVLGLYSYFVLSLIAIAIDFNFVMEHEKIRWVAGACFLLFLGMTVFFMLGFSGRLYRASHVHLIMDRIAPLKKVMEGFQRFGANRRILALSVVVSLVAQMFTMLFFYRLGQVLNEPDATWNAIMFAVPMGFVVTAVPIAPAGLGVGQLAFLYLFQTYMNKTSQFGALSITAYQLATATWALAGIVFWLRRRKPHELDNIDAQMEATPS